MESWSVIYVKPFYAAILGQRTNMETPSEVQEPEVYEILKIAVQDGLDHIRELESQNKYIGTYFRFPQLKWRENGFPSITTNDWTQKGPTKYQDAFYKEYVQQTESWQAFLNTISKHPKLQTLVSTNLYIKNEIALNFCHGDRNRDKNVPSR